MRKISEDLAAKYGVAPQQIDRVYGNLLTGFSATLSPAQAAALREDPSVQMIEEDGMMYALNTVTQNSATWGIDRVDQAALPLSTTYTYSNTGSGVNVYIIDTGIRTTHNEFGGRAIQGYDAFGGNSEDCNGHGTHVA